MFDRSIKLPTGLLEALIEEFTDPDTVGFLLAGSYARGDAARYSDIDLMKFVRRLPEDSGERYIVRFRDEYLVCVTATTVAEKLDEIHTPAKAIWAVPGIGQAAVLSDSFGELAGLKHAAENLRWEDLQPAADTYASCELAGLTEEVHKLLNASISDDSSAAEYAVIGLLLGLTKIAAVKLGVMIPTENVYFACVREAVGTQSGWTRHHAMTCDGVSLDLRMSASLNLYIDTARLVGRASHTEHAAVIDQTVGRIERLLTNS